MKIFIASRINLALIVLIALIARPVVGQSLQLISSNNPSLSPAAGGSGDSLAPVISPDGRYVLFASTANNLALDSSGNPIATLFPPRLNVYLRDRTNQTTALVSVNVSGTGGNGDSIPIQISTNGQFVLFESFASDLVPGDTNGTHDVFMRDLIAGTTTLVSIGTNGSTANDVSRSSVMTPDGRYVAFVSAATNLVVGDADRIPDVFVRDLQSGTTVLVSVGASGLLNSSESPDITPDGHYVVFYSTATGLVNGITTTREIYVRDMVGGTTTCVSSNAHTILQAVMGTVNTVSYNHTISDDGQFVAFEASPTSAPTSAYGGVILRYNLSSGLTDIVNTNANGVILGYEAGTRSLDMTPDGRFITFIANATGNFGSNTCVFVWDSQSNATTLVSGDLTNGLPTDSLCDSPVIDPTGRYIAFMSGATNLVTNTLTSQYNQYLRDTQAGTTALVDADTNGVGAVLNPVSVPRMSADARYIAFEYPDGNLVPNDSNRAYDVVMRGMSANTNELISTRLPALPSFSPNAPSWIPTIATSTNGRYFAFVSEADNLVANDTNDLRDVFVHDFLTGSNVLVSVDTNGVFSGNGVSTDPSMSGDGRYIAFVSSATNLVAGDTNNAQDVFLRDLQTGITSLVSINAASNGPGNRRSFSPTISTDGRYVLFHSFATNLVSSFPFRPPLPSGPDNLFLRDLSSGATYALTTNGTASAISYSMTPNGRFTAFSLPSPAGVYIWDSQAAAPVYTNTSASATGFGISPNGQWLIYSASNQLYAGDIIANTNVLITAQPLFFPNMGIRFSADSRFVAYAASGAAPPEIRQIYLYDFLTGTNLLLSQNFTSNGGGNTNSDSPAISSDGSFIAYRSLATNIVQGDGNGFADVFLYDRVTGLTTLVSSNLLGTLSADSESTTPIFTGDGQTLLFQSWASDLAPNNFGYNSDVYAIGLNSSGAITPFNVLIVPFNNGQGPTLTWPAVTGRSYQVLYKNSLADPVWQQLSGIITVLGNKGYFEDTTPINGERFYQIVGF